MQYLSGTNVQLGATYKTSQASTKLYNDAYASAATFANAKPNEIGWSLAVIQSHD